MEAMQNRSCLPCTLKVTQMANPRTTIRQCCEAETRACMRVNAVVKCAVRRKGRQRRRSSVYGAPGSAGAAVVRMRTLVRCRGGYRAAWQGGSAAVQSVR